MLQAMLQANVINSNTFGGQKQLFDDYFTESPVFPPYYFRRRFDEPFSFSKQPSNMNHKISDPFEFSLDSWHVDVSMQTVQASYYLRECSHVLEYVVMGRNNTCTSICIQKIWNRYF